MAYAPAPLRNGVHRGAESGTAHHITHKHPGDLHRADRQRLEAALPVHAHTEINECEAAPDPLQPRIAPWGVSQVAHWIL